MPSLQKQTKPFRTNPLSSQHIPWRDPKVWSIYFLSFSSGLPFLLTLATLQVWLKEEGLSNGMIGLFALVTLPYSLKFLWAPIMDTVRIPILGKLFGHRKSWILLSQFFLIPSLLCLGQSSPGSDPLMTAFTAFWVAFFSATQDIGVEAYRIDLLEKKHVGFGSGISNLGYRTGMWVSGAGALYLSAMFNWGATYALMALCIGFGIVATLLSPDLSILKKAHEAAPLKAHGKILKHILQIPTPWVTILMIIMLFKLADTFLNVMSIPFMIDLGFSKIDIANVGKSFGIAAMVAGGITASIALTRMELFQVFCITGCLQMASSVLFMIQSLVGTSFPLLFATVGLDNFSCGMGAAAFVTYLSHLSRHEFSATHFAFLSSIASLCRVAFSYLSGLCADAFTWTHYFMGTGMITVAYFLVILWAKPHLLDITQELEFKNLKAA